MSDFFASGPGEGTPRILHGVDLRSFPIVDGISVEPVLGERLNVNVVTLLASAVAAVHVHDEEQIGYVVKGACEFTDGVQTWTLAAGDLYHCAPRVPHGARALGEGCVIIDAFAPPRAGIAEMLDGNT